MSTILLKESFNPLTIQYSKSFVVSVGRPKLAELVRRRASELNNLSTNEIARRAKAKGYDLSNGTVWNVMNNRVKDVKEETLNALAYALELSIDEVLAAYYDKPLEFENPLDEIGVLFYGWDEASDEDKAATLESIRMIAESFQRRRRKSPKKKVGDSSKGKK